MTKELNEFEMVVIGVEFDHYTSKGNPVYNVYGVDSYGDLMTFKTAANSQLGYEIKNYMRKYCRIRWHRRGNNWDKIIDTIKDVNDGKTFKLIMFEWNK